MIARILTYLERAPRPLRIAASVACVIALGVAYGVTGFQVTFFMFFLIPISFMTWTIGFSSGFCFACLSVITLMICDVFGRDDMLHPLVIGINEALRMISFVTSAWVLSFLKKLVEGHKSQARTDDLTGIANRRAFYESARLEIARSSRNPKPFTLVLTDIDNFKSINDRFGHLVGDHLLVLTADIMRQNIREIDQIARLGGDEFVLLLTETDAIGACAVMERLRVDLTAMALRQRWPITYSSGAVTFSHPPESVDEMITKADTLMYSVKRSGKDHMLHANE